MPPYQKLGYGVHLPVARTRMPAVCVTNAQNYVSAINETFHAALHTHRASSINEIMGSMLASQALGLCDSGGLWCIAEYLIWSYQ